MGTGPLPDSSPGSVPVNPAAVQRRLSILPAPVVAGSTDSGSPRYSTVDAPLADDVSSGRCDSTGIPDVALLRRLLPDNDAEFFFCGPREFMAGLYRGLRDWGVDESRIHFEFFGPKEDLNGDA